MYAKYITVDQVINVLNQTTLTNINQDSYRIGQFRDTPHLLTFLDQISRKKMHSFSWTSNQEIRIQVIFIDIGFTSAALITFFSEKTGQIFYQKFMGFALEENFQKCNLNLNIERRQFIMKVKQNRYFEDNNNYTKSTFYIKIHGEGENLLELNLTHITREEQCITALRSKATSYKCYGGYGEGKVSGKMYHKGLKKYVKIESNLIQNMTRTAIDRFKASGFEWKWTWVFGHGYPNNQKIEKESWIGLNFGSMYNKSEDFIFLNGEIYAVKNLRYIFNESQQLNTNILFQSEAPQFEANLTITHFDHKLKDMGIGKSQMIRMEGSWNGWIIDPRTNQKIDLIAIPGLIESADSIG